MNAFFSLQDLGHPIGSQFSSSSPMTIDVPLSDMNHGLLGHNQLTTIDQSELSAQLGLSLGGGTILPRPQSPDQPLSATDSPSDSLHDDDMDDFRRVGFVFATIYIVCLIIQFQSVIKCLYYEISILIQIHLKF